MQIWYLIQVLPQQRYTDADRKFRLTGSIQHLYQKTIISIPACKTVVIFFISVKGQIDQLHTVFPDAQHQLLQFLSLPESESIHLQKTGSGTVVLPAELYVFRKIRCIHTIANIIKSTEIRRGLCQFLHYSPGETHSFVRIHPGCFSA